MVFSVILSIRSLKEIFNAHRLHFGVVSTNGRKVVRSLELAEGNGRKDGQYQNLVLLVITAFKES